MPHIEINYLAVLVCGIAAMIIGFIWYGPLFGKLWMKVNNISPEDIQKRAEMQKSAGPLYLIQFLLLLLQATVISAVFTSTTTRSVGTLFVCWLIFVMPTVAGMCMWNNESKKVSLTKFVLQAGYYLIIFVVFGWILGSWK